MGGLFGWMDGLMGGWVGCLGGWMDGWMDGSTIKVVSSAHYDNSITKQFHSTFIISVHRCVCVCVIVFVCEHVSMFVCLRTCHIGILSPVVNSHLHHFAYYTTLPLQTLFAFVSDQ